MIGFYTVLGVLRNNYSALRTGDFATLLMGDITANASDNNTYAFARSDKDRSIIVVMNNGTISNTATIPVGNYFSDGTELTDGVAGAVCLRKEILSFPAEILPSPFRRGVD